jgi:hypothetical protein
MEKQNDMKNRKTPARDDPNRTHARASLVRFLSRAGRGNGSEGFDGPLALELK